MSLADYMRQHPDREVQVCMNVQNSENDRRIRVTILKLLRPYRPKTLGVFVVNTIEEALAHEFTPEQQADPVVKWKNGEGAQS